MNELKINKKIETEVESMFLLGKQIGELKKKYPMCWAVLKAQFGLADYNNKYFEDSVDNLKIRLYAEIVKRDSEKKKQKEEDIKKELKK